MEKKLLDRLIDASLMITVVVAVMYWCGRQYLGGYLQSLGLSIHQFDISLPEFTAHGSHILLLIIAAVPIAFLGFNFLDFLWNKFWKKSEIKPKWTISREFFYTVLSIPVLMFCSFVILYSRVLGDLAAQKDKGKTEVRILTSSNVIFEGKPHLLLKLGGDYLIYDETGSGEGLIHIIPEEQIIQISHLLLKR